MWLLIIFIAALFLGLNNVLLKNCLRKEHTMPTIFSISAVVALLSLVFYKKIDFSPSLDVMILILIKSMLLGFVWYLMFNTLKRMDISEHAPLRNLSSIFLIIMSYFFLGERLSVMQYIGIMIIIIGAYVLELHHITHFFEPFKKMADKNILKLFVALILMSVCAIYDKLILVNMGLNITTLLFFNHSIVAVFFLIMIFFNGYIKDIFVPFKQDLPLVFIISIMAVIADMSYFFVAALATVPISLIIPLKRFSNLISVVLGGRFFHEERLMHKATSCCIMIFGVFILFI